MFGKYSTMILLLSTNLANSTMDHLGQDCMLIYDMILKDKIRFEWADIIYDMSKARHL